jgi:PAS domain S-box-containing protein
MRFLKSSNSLQVKGPAKVLGYYFLFSFLWIVSTDLLSHFFARQDGLYLHTIKGILYVCFSGAILWILTRSVVIEANRLEGTVAEIFQQSEFGVFILDERGTILDCNERCAGMLGYRTAEIVGKTEPKFIPADQNLRSPGARSGDSVYRYAHRDGHYISARVAASRTQLPSGESFIVGLLHNVTDEVNAYRVIREQETAISAMSVAVRKSEARSKLLMDTDLVGVCVASTDGGVLDANDYFLNMLGLSREELREGKVSWASSTHQDFAERDLHAIDELKITHRIVPYEKTFIAKDGSVIPVLISANFLSEDANGIMEALVSVIDLREIKKAQAELSRLAQAVESAYEAIVVTDSDFRIVYCNPAFEVLTGYERVEVESQSLIRLLDDHSVGITGSANWKTLYEGGPWRGRIWQRRKSGSDYLEDVTVTPVRDKSGRLTNYLTIRKDVTREFALEQQLFQAQKMEAVGQLAGGIAHDLNNVLQAVQSSADLGIRRSPDADYVAKKLRDIMKASERGAAIIAQLLAFTRNDSHASKRTDLNEVVSDTARLLQRLLPAHIDFKTELSSKLHSIEADSVQISQVILNLCVNARDAMPEGGVLRVQTRNYEQGGEKGVMLSVQDNGTGIEERIKKKIF